MSRADLAGKTAAVLGVADRESIAWAIALGLARSGARVVVGYQQRFWSRVRPLLDETPGITARRCDVLDKDEVDAFFLDLRLDILVHAVAHAPPAVFTRPPSGVTSADFAEMLEVSTHSLAKVVGAARSRLNPWASVMTLTFQASDRAVPFYGLMGVAKAALESLVRYLAVELGEDRIRVNAISAGPVQTLAGLGVLLALRRDPEALRHIPSAALDEALAELAASGAPGAPGEVADDERELALLRGWFRRIQQEFAARSAIPELVEARDIAELASFLASDSSRKITGQVLHVDCGFSACQLL